MLPTVQISTFLEICGGSETDRNSWNMDVQKSFEVHNLKIVGFDSHTRYQVKQ